MNTDKSILFTPGKIGPLTFRDRTIRTAAFESTCPGNTPPEQLFNYHTSVVTGGIGMTNIAYAAMTQSGLSLECQLWMRSDVIPGLRKLTDVIHEKGATASIQLGHCGNTLHKRIYGCTPILASSGFNLYSPAIVQDMRQSEVTSMTRAYGETIRSVRKAGMGAAEIRARHGYLISQFLSPYTSHRKDEYGGSLKNRMRFKRICTGKVMKVTGSDMTVTTKINIWGGFKGGLEIGECLEVARTLQDQCGVHASVLSGGFANHTPMHVMRGEMSIHTTACHMPRDCLPIGIRTVDKYMIPLKPFKEAYFLEDALKSRKVLHLPLIYVEGSVSRNKIEKILNDRFEFVAVARALVNESDFVDRMKENEHVRCDCGHSNYCVIRMYSEDMVYHRDVRGLPECIIHEIKKLEYR